MGRQKAC